jgi:hypothetical protein
VTHCDPPSPGSTLPPQCKIYVGDQAFKPDAASFWGVTNKDDALLLYLLHELAHADGVDPTVVDGDPSFNQSIVDNCIKPLDAGQ